MVCVCKGQEPVLPPRSGANAIPEKPLPCWDRQATPEHRAGISRGTGSWEEGHSLQGRPGQPLTPEPVSAPISKGPARSPGRPEEGAAPGVWAMSHQVPMSSLFSHTGKLVLLVPQPKTPSLPQAAPPSLPTRHSVSPSVSLKHTMHLLLALPFLSPISPGEL